MQTEFPYIGAVSSPKRAPDSLLARVTSDMDAVRVSLIGIKAAYVAETIGVSTAYLSLLRNGHRPFPERLVIPFCHATGSLLLAQHRELKAALRAIRGAGEQGRIESIARELRAAA